MARPAPHPKSPSLSDGDLIAAVVAESDADGVLSWRFEQLRAAGYDVRRAAQIARTFEIDLHRAVALLERGCPVETALRILL
ncbi:MAG: hypothetical protein ACKVUT_02125 [Gaiella sp.]